jgi:uncharacterized membrane protein YhhN
VTGPVALGVAAVAGLLAAEGRGWRPGVWLFKPLASAAFLWAALARGALGTGYGRLVLAALALGALGDVLLIPRDRRAFMTGLGTFLLGHVVFAAAFLTRPFSPAAAGLAALGMAAFGRAVLGWLRPHLPRRLIVPVVAYVVVIGVMVATAAGASFGTERAAFLAGAAMFALSDLSVARRRFVEPRFAEAAWGLPLYFAAQFVLASTVGWNGG